MHCLPFWVYRVEQGERHLYRISCYPQVDAYFWQQRGAHGISVLTPSLSLAAAEQALTSLNASQERGQSADKALERLSRSLKLRLPRPQLVEPPAKWQGEREADQLLEFLAGRILLLEEVERGVRERRLALQQPLPHLLQYLYLQGLVQCRPAVSAETKRCLRCGNTSLVAEPCLECGDTHGLSCPQCSEMGQAKACRPYYAILPIAEVAAGLESTATRTQVAELRLPVTLTPAQLQASAQLSEFLQFPGGSRCLFWAVCGAGKTEAVLPAIQQVLNSGGRVLWATPRRDVVTELQPRLAASFPRIEVAEMHGQATERFPSSPLVLATTHQALRLYAAFDLVILDEVDAFPYVSNPMLALAVQRATKPNGRIIYLTATPTPELLRQAQRGEVAEVLLPVRHHGHPLPEPEIHLARLGRPSNGVWRRPPLLERFLMQSLERDLCQMLIFVPSVSLAEEVGSNLQAYFAETQGMPEWVESVHAADPQREEKRRRFFAGEFPVLVTTTLLERGVTLRRVNIAVLWADRDQIFQEAVLMQIAGRSGRAVDYPRGRVWFVGEKRTKAMLGARKKIVNLNKTALEMGLLHE